MKKLIATLLMSASIATHAQVSTLCVNCGNEATQYLNYGELLTHTTQGAAQLRTQISQYAAMIQNLQQLPGERVSSLMGPQANQIVGLVDLYSATNSLFSAASQANSVVSNTLSSAAAMNMTPSQYNAYVANQARTRGGVYQQMMTNNNNSMRNLQKVSESFQKAAEKVPDLQGNLDSLGQLNTLAAASGQVATEMLATNQAALNLQLDDRKKSEDAAAVMIEDRQRRDDDFKANLNALGTGLKANKVWQ
jgi:P-type conjugative transfer protein TrbJ